MKKISGVIIGGLIAAVGIAAMIKPLQAFIEVGWLIGALLMIHGVERIYRAITEKNIKVTDMVFRVIEVIAGAAILGSTMLRILTDIMVVYTAGGLVVAYGLYFMLSGLKKAERNSGKILRAAIGLIIIGLGAVLIYEPAGTMIAIIYTVATALALQGVDIIMISLVGRKEAFKDE